MADFLAHRGVSSGKVLDVPCGRGRIFIPLARLGYRVVGVDISPHFVEVSKKKAEESGVGDKVSFHVG